MDASTRVTLNDGWTIPQVGLGVFRTAAGEEAKRAVRTALEVGYRHIDTAAIYENERSVGEAIRESGVPREDVFVTTKLWNEDHDAPAQAFARSLKALGLGYVDLYLIHWPIAEKRTRTWSELERLVKSGDVRSIGVSNYLVPHLEELLAAATVLPAVNQIELSPYSYRSRLDTVTLCREHGIAIEAYSPLTRGRKLADPRLDAIGPRKKSAAQKLIRWGLQRDLIVLPKSARPTRIEENLDVFDFELSSEDMDALDALDENLLVAWDPRRQP